MAAVLFSALLLAGAEASARNETLQWTHSNPSTVDGFRVYWRASGSSTQNPVEAGLPAAGSNSYSFTVANVPDTADVYFTVRAYNTGGDSPSSNEICRGPSGACGGTTGGGGGGGTSTGVTGFKVWNAQTDTVIDDDFQSGETITASCAAIEIVGNISGSVRKFFDNNLGACENSAPFGYDDGSSVGWNCSTLLTNGSHSLSVTVYSAKDCTGTPATPVSRTFTVNIGGTTSPEPTLGTPGKPYLVQ